MTYREMGRISGHIWPTRADGLPDDLARRMDEFVSGPLTEAARADRMHAEAEPGHQKEFDQIGAVIVAWRQKQQEGKSELSSSQV